MIRENSKSKSGRLQLIWNYIRMVYKISILNKSLYTFKFADDVEAEYSANIIADNIWAQWDNDVSQLHLMGDHLKHKSDRIASTIIPVVTTSVYIIFALDLDTNSDSSFTSISQVWASQMEE